MGCGSSCCCRSLDVLAPQRKAPKVPPGARSSSSSQPQPTFPPFPGPLHYDARQNLQHRHSQQLPPCGHPPLQPKIWGQSHTEVTPEPPEPGYRVSEGHALSAEDTILAEGSRLQGLCLVPWDDQDEDIACNFGLGSKLTKAFEDSDGLLELSSRQREALHAWRRMPDIIRGVQGHPAVLVEPKPASKNIRQGLVGDCSFLSALSALADYEEHFNDPVLSGILHPRGSIDGRSSPFYNEYGQYACRLFLNGTSRKVVVDDRVPVRDNNQLLCAHSATTSELWVTLLEKSFAKIMGSSYDMQGSNPGVDIFHLTGWVPETVPLNGEEAAIRDRCDWDEVFNTAAEGYQNGRCVVCLGTSELHDAAPNAEARRLGHIEGVSTSTGLVARHAYPVLDCRHLGGHRLLRLKNPWGRVRWRGAFAPGDPRWESVKAKAVGESGSSQRITKLLGHDPGRETPDDGHFWIEWQDVRRYFSHLYLCWAPRRLGLHRLEVHGRWDPGPHFIRSSLPDDTHIVAWNPQFLLRLEQPMAPGAGIGLWVLLSRHVRDRAEISTRYVAAHVYQASDHLCCPDAPLEQGVYSNGECTLNKVCARSMGDAREFVIVVSQHANKAAFNFTLQVYASVPGTLAPLAPVVEAGSPAGSAVGRWTPETAGGCSNNLWHYFQNPQWRIEVPGGGVEDFVLFVECPLEHSVNVRLFQSGVARPEALRSTLSSGPYRQGCCVLRAAELPPGSYVAVVSTFRAGLVGDYRLAWHASQALRLSLQPHPFAVPLDAPIVSSAHWVPPAASSSFLLRSHQPGGDQVANSPQTFSCALVSLRVQVSWRSGVPPRVVLSRRRVPPVEGDAVSGQRMPVPVLEPMAGEPQDESYAMSYFAVSGSTVLLLAELVHGESYQLDVSIPECVDGQKGDRALYINASSPVAVELLKQSPATGTDAHGAAGV